MEEAHEAVRSGKFNSPSRTVKMPLREAAARMVRNGDGEGGECFWFPNCLPILTLCFTGVYVQALITDELAKEAGLTPEPSSRSNTEGEQARSVKVKVNRRSRGGAWIARGGEKRNRRGFGSPPRVAPHRCISIPALR